MRYLHALWIALLLVPASLPGQRSADLHPPGSWGFPQAALAADTLTAYGRQQGWFSRDKGLHFGISAVGAGALYAAGRTLGLKRWQAAAAAAVVMGGVGILREVATDDPDNLLTRQKLSRRDLVWDAAGIVVGISVTDHLFRRRDRSREE